MTKRDGYWVEAIDRAGPEKMFDTAIGRLEFFKANTKLAPGSEGWGHLDLTVGLLCCVADALFPETAENSIISSKED